MKKALIFMGILIFIVISLVLLFPSLVSLNLTENKAYLQDDSGVIKVYSNGDLTKLVAYKDRGFEVVIDENYENSNSYKAIDDEKVYYVAKENVTFKKNDLFSSGEAFVNSRTNVYKTSGFIQNRPTDFVKEGTKVMIEEVKYVKGREWIKISWDERTGYVLGRYISKTAPEILFDEDYSAKNELANLDLGKKIDNSSAINNEKFTATYLNFEGVIDEEFDQKLTEFNNMGTVYIEYFDGDVLLAPIDYLTIPDINQKAVIDKQEFKSIVDKIKDQNKRVAVEVSLTKNSLIKNTGDYIDVDNYDNWMFYSDLITDLAAANVDEIVFKNLGVEGGNDQTSVQLQLLYGYIYDFASSTDLQISAKLDHDQVFDSKVRKDNTQLNVISNQFDNLYIQFIYNDMPKNYLGEIYPWNTPANITTKVLSEFDKTNKFSLSPANLAVSVQAFSSPEGVYPNRYYDVELMGKIIYAAVRGNARAGYVLINNPSDLSDYDFLRELLNE